MHNIMHSYNVNMLEMTIKLIAFHAIDYPDF